MTIKIYCQKAKLEPNSLRSREDHAYYQTFELYIKPRMTTMQQWPALVGDIKQSQAPRTALPADSFEQLEANGEEFCLFWMLFSVLYIEYLMEHTLTAIDTQTAYRQI